MTAEEFNLNRVAELEAERDQLRRDLEDAENEAIRLRDDLNAHQKIGAEAILRNVRVDKITEGYRNLHVKQYHQIQNLKDRLEAERVRTLEEMKFLQDDVRHRTRNMHVLAKQVAALTEALTMYADRSLYLHEDGKCAPICADEGEKARAALQR